MANDWSEKMAGEFVALAKDSGDTAIGEISARLRGLVEGALDKSKRDHAAAAHAQAREYLYQEQDRRAEVDAAVLGQVGSSAGPGDGTSASGTDANADWKTVKPQNGPPAWAPNTAHVMGESVTLPHGSIVQATNDGTTGAEPPLASIQDGTVVWSAG